MPVPTGGVAAAFGSPLATAATDPTAAELERLRRGIRIMALGELRDPDAADEVAQECLGRVLRAVREGRLRSPQSLGAFARAIAHHVIVDTLRSRRRHVRLDPDQGEVMASGEDPLSALLSAEQSARLTAGLQQLPAPDRELLRLSFFEGLTPQQLALRLREPGARIRKRKERALQRLRGLLSGVVGHESVRPATEVAKPQSVPTRPRMPE